MMMLKKKDGDDYDCKKEMVMIVKKKDGDDDGCKEEKMMLLKNNGDDDDCNEEKMPEEPIRDLQRALTQPRNIGATATRAFCNL